MRAPAAAALLLALVLPARADEMAPVLPGALEGRPSPRDTSPTSYPLYQREHMRAAQAPMKDVERFVPERIVTSW